MSPELGDIAIVTQRSGNRFIGVYTFSIIGRTGADQ